MADDGADRLAVLAHSLLTPAGTVVEAARTLRRHPDLSPDEIGEVLDVLERNAVVTVEALQRFVRMIDLRDPAVDVRAEPRTDAAEPPAT